MIELTKEKHFSPKDPKLPIPKKGLNYDKFRISKYTCSTSFSMPDNRIIIYLGMSSGAIIALTIFKQKSMFQKYEEFTLYKCHEQFTHKGPVNVMTCQLIENVPILFSGGVDGTIKVWQGDPELREKDMVHHIKTILAHKGTVIALTFSSSRNILVSSSSDFTMRVYRMNDKFDKILNPRFECISIIKDFHIQLNKDKDLPYWITTLSLKETDIIELYAGDTKGRILFYHYVDDNYIKYRGRLPDSMNSNQNNLVKNNFNFVKAVNLHRHWGTIKVIHSIFDSVIYSAGFDNHIVCYNVKNGQRMFEIANSNNKNSYSALTINYFTQELIVGDNCGNITFVKIFNKTENKVHATNSKILDISTLEIFPDQEHILCTCEDNITIYKVNRKTKVANLQHHDAELLKVFAIEPITINEKIIEDAKLISAAYDNTIKMWDFLTMECINFINGPELPRKNVEMSTICYLHDSMLIAVGTDIGNIFFWDLNRSEYLKNNYENYVKHKLTVTSITSFIVQGKDGVGFKENIVSCASDGLILIWEIQKTEIKQGRKEVTYEEEDRFLMQNSVSNRENPQAKKMNSGKLLKPQGIPQKQFKCVPQIKLVINTASLLKAEVKLTVVAYSPNQPNKTIYTGAQDKFLYMWDFVKGGYIDKVETSNSSVTCLTFDKNFLISGGVDGAIDVWNIPKDPGHPLTLLITLRSGNDIVRIHDVIMLASTGILVSCDSSKKIHLWKYEQEKLLASVSKEQEVTCLAAVESYGKLICGTKEKTIIEIDLAETLNNIGFKHSYVKYPFLKNEINYIESAEDKKISVRDIMSSLTQGMDEFK